MLARLRILFGFGTVQPGPAGNEEYARELAQLEARLREDKARTEALAKIHYAQWRLRKERDKELYLKYGVSVPLTTEQRDQDEFFLALEARLKEERQTHLEQTRALESREHETARIERERQSTERILTVLEGDME